MTSLPTSTEFPWALSTSPQTGSDDFTGNSSGNSSFHDDLPEYFKEGHLSILVILLVLTVLGNSLVLTAIALSRNRQSSRMNFFIMNVAVCDLLTGPLNTLPDILSKTVVYWYAGDMMCRLYKFFALTVTFASNYMLVALSIDRLDAVARPMQFKGSGMKVKVLVSVAWALSGLFAISGLVLFHVAVSHGGPMCQINLSSVWKWKVYITLVAISLVLGPALIILICYVSIVVLIFNRSHLLQDMDTERKKKSADRKNNKAKHGDTELLRQCRLSNGGNSHITKGIIPQAKIRTIKMTFLIVLVFILCWSPYFVFNLIDLYGHIPNTVTWKKIRILAQSLTSLNSAANPIIYGIFSTRICKYFGKEFLSTRLARVASLCQRSEAQPETRTSAADYTSMSETEDIRISPDIRQGGSIQNGGNRVPLVHQKLTEEDRELLSLHVRFTSHDKQDDVENFSTCEVKVEAQK